MMAKGKPKDYPLTIVQFDAKFELPLPIFLYAGLSRELWRPGQNVLVGFLQGHSELPVGRGGGGEE